MARSITCEEADLLADPKYRNFMSQMDKALKGFESTSEWADLVNALGKLNKVLQNNTHNSTAKYSVIPRRFVVGQRLAQCMHPALPSGVHLKALETYDLIFECIGTDKLVQELSVYSNGLFPLLSHAAINVKPSLLKVYEKHFVPLGERLRPALDGFLIAVLPGLEEGSDFCQETENILKQVCDGVSKEYFYGALWRCVLNNPSVRLAAITFVTSQVNRKKNLDDQMYILGSNITTMVNAVCTSLLDSMVLVQRAILDFLLCCFPLHETQIPREDYVEIATAAVTVLLRRDISLNRRLFSWLFGLEVAPAQPKKSKRKRDAYFEVYSRDKVADAFINCLTDPSLRNVAPGAWSSLGEAWTLRLLICLLDNAEIRVPLIDDLSIDIFRSLFHEYQRNRKMKQSTSNNLIVKVLNNLGSAYTWKRLMSLFTEACSNRQKAMELLQDASMEGISLRHKPNILVTELINPVQRVGNKIATVTEMCTLLQFVTDLSEERPELFAETSSLFLPSAIHTVLTNLTEYCSALSTIELNASLTMVSKIMLRIPASGATKPSFKIDESREVDRDSLNKIREENESDAISTQLSQVSSMGAEDVTSLASPTLPEKADIVSSLTTLFIHFGTTRLLIGPSWKESFDELKTNNKMSIMSTISTVSVDAQMIDVFTHLCELLIKCNFLSEEQDPGVVEPKIEDSAIPDWLKLLLVLSSMSGSSVVVYTTLSTYLALVTVLRAKESGKTLSTSVTRLSPSNAPTIDFGKQPEVELTLVSPLIMQSYLEFVFSETNFYPHVTKSLWENLSDEKCNIHLETAFLLQQIHNLVDESPVCENVICSSMASVDEVTSYEARKRFSTLYNVTRDLSQANWSFMNRREFDRPLFFMLDSLSHKLDAHNAQAVDWLNQCLKNGDIARILEPLLFILLHPDTARVSVQHISAHQSDIQPEAKESRMHESDNAAQAMEEAKIYAISCTGGNTLYHVSPEGKPRKFNSSPIPAPKTILISQGQRSTLADHEFPPPRPGHLHINMTVNPFGSMSSLASDALDNVEIRHESTRRYPNGDCRSWDELRFKGTPTPPPPHKFRTPTIPIKSFSIEDDVDVVNSVLSEIVDKVVRQIGDDRPSSSSSSSCETTTRQTYSESISLSNWLKPVSVNQLHSHILLYTRICDSRRTLYALTTLWNIISADAGKVLFSLATTSISNRLGARSQELQTLCARHRKSLFGRGFYCDLDTESVTAFRSSTFLEVIVTTCLFYIRSYYPGLPQPKLNEDEIVGNQKVRILSSEMLALIFNELIPAIKGKPTFTCYLYDMLIRCKIQKIALHSLVSSVYNLQVKGCGIQSSNVKVSNGSDDVLSDAIIELNDKLSCSAGFQEDFQKSLLKLLEQLMILENKSAPAIGNDKDLPTHNRKISSDSRASRIRFQPQMSSLKYCPNVPIPSQAMFLSAIQAALQETSNIHLHLNWLQLVEASLPYAGRSLTRLIVCVVSQVCHNIEMISHKICEPSPNIEMPANYLLGLLKSLGVFCHYCLCDSSQTLSPPMSPQPHTVGGSSVSSVNPLQTLSNFLHVFSSDQSEQITSQSTKDHGSDPVVSTRRTLLNHLPRVVSSLRSVWKAVGSSCPSGWQVMGRPKDVKSTILELLSPISLLHGTNFMAAVAVVWHELRDSKSENNRSVVASCSIDQSILVDLIVAIRVFPMDIIVQTVKQVMKQPPIAAPGRKKKVPLEVSTLQFFLAYIRAVPGSQLLESWKSLLLLLREGLQASSQPLVQFYLLAILHEFVQAAPLIEDRKDQKDLQDLAQKLVDACTTVAAARLGQTRWLRRNLEVKPGPQNHQVEDDTDDNLSDQSMTMPSMDGQEPANENSYLAKFSVQALNALAEFVAPVLDVVYVSEEKEKVVPLVANIIYYVTPYLRNHSKQNAPSFKASSHLLASISGYQYSRKAWRKEAFELFLDPCFFQMEPSCFVHWKTVIDHLMTHDKSTFRDFLSRMSVTQTGSLKLPNMFSNKDQENESRSQLAKRLAFILFCSEKDQYQRYMPEIQEKLIECLRVNGSPSVQGQILLCFRVLLLRMSHQHLTSLWPFIYTEMFQTFLQIEQELNSPVNGDQFRRSQSGSFLHKMDTSTWSLPNQANGVAGTNSVLQLYLYACKLLDLAMALPAENLPQFQMYKWAFIGGPVSHSPDNESRITSFSDRLSVPSPSARLSHSEDNLHRGGSRTPSPSPSKISVLTRTSTLFEPHIVRIEKIFRKKNPYPELCESEGHQLLTLTSIKSLMELQPFFSQLVRTEGSVSLEKRGMVTSPTGQAMDKFCSLLDTVVENDFIEEIIAS